MSRYQEAIAILESLSPDWEWSVSKYGRWYHVLIKNDGLRHEPCYTNALESSTPEGRTDLLESVQCAYKAYQQGENSA